MGEKLRDSDVLYMEEGGEVIGNKRGGNVNDVFFGEEGGSKLGKSVEV